MRPLMTIHQATGRGLGLSAAFLAAALLASGTAAARSADPAPSQQVGPVEVPQGLSAEAWAGIRDQMAAARYAAAAIPSAPERVGAHNPGQDLLLQFDAQGARVESLRRAVPADGGLAATPLQLQTLALVRGTQRRAVTAVRPVTEGPRIEYRHDGWTEWYVNRAEGVEHGYTLDERPLGGAVLPAQAHDPAQLRAGASRKTDVMPAQAGIQSGDGRASQHWIPASAGMTDNPLRIELAVTGMRASQAGEALRFTNAAGGSLHYGKLWVVDADGQTLPATLTALSEDRIEIAFDDSQAKYPVVVDPLLINEEAVLFNPPIDAPVGNSSFGFSVALDGDTLVVGSPNHPAAGRLYFYSRIDGVWVRDQVIQTVTGVEGGQQPGYALALEGETLLLGIPLVDSNAQTNSGAVYVIERQAGVWAQTAELVASDAATNRFFGVAVDLEGDTAVIGSSGNGLVAGAAYIFGRSDGVWSEQAQLQPLDVTAADRFGTAVAVSLDTLVAGASGRSNGAGAAYAYTRTDGIWSEQQVLLPVDAADGNAFGSAVAVEGDTALIGAIKGDGPIQTDIGAVHVFVRSLGVWTEDAKLLDPDTLLDPPAATFGQQFGRTIALEGDVAVIGAHLKTIAGKSTAGAAFVFVRAAGVWSSQARIEAADAATGDQFGISVALSGGTVAVGAHLDDLASFNQGSAYVFEQAAGVWTQQTQVTAFDSNGDAFGYAVAVDGDTALIGAPDSQVGTRLLQGAAWVFVRDGTSWTQQARLLAADGAASDRFGMSVALSGDTALVGAPMDNVLAESTRGSVYAFVRQGTSWSQEAQLIAADGLSGDRFGWSIALDGDVALLGAPEDDESFFNQGSAYVFTRSAGNWSQQGAKLLAPVTGLSGPSDNDRFGTAVAISGNTALIGEYLDDVTAGSDHGSAHVFVEAGGSWAPQAQLVAADRVPSDLFGWSVDVDGDTAVVGAIFENSSGAIKQGAGYVFRRDAGVWTEEAKLLAADGAANDQFGHAVAVSGNVIVVGVYLDDVSAKANQGSAYVFERSAEVWSQIGQLSAADGAAEDRFGWAVALSADTALIGAYLDDVPNVGVNGGSVLIVRIAADPDADSDGDGMTDAYENANGLNPAADDAAEDLDGDGLSNLEEFQAGTAANDADTDDDGLGDAIDAEPVVASNACLGANAVFENQMVLSGTVRQCAASESVDVEPTVTVEPGGRVDVYAPQTGFSSGFTLPVGAELRVVPAMAP